MSTTVSPTPRQCGVIDPTKIVRTALLDRASRRNLLISSEALAAKETKNDGCEGPLSTKEGDNAYLGLPSAVLTEVATLGYRHKLRKRHLVDLHKLLPITGLEVDDGFGLQTFVANRVSE